MSTTLGLSLVATAFVIGAVIGIIWGVRNMAKHPEKALDEKKLLQALLVGTGQKKNPQQMRQMLNQFKRQLK